MPLPWIEQNNQGHPYLTWTRAKIFCTNVLILLSILKCLPCFIGLLIILTETLNKKKLSPGGSMQYLVFSFRVTITGQVQFLWETFWSHEVLSCWCEEWVWGLGVKRVKIKEPWWWGEVNVQHGWKISLHSEVRKTKKKMIIHLHDYTPLNLL